MLPQSPPPFSHDDPFFSRLVFLDMEATGLSETSVPTEFGACGLDLVPKSFLIRPRQEWQDSEWSPVAEAMTGITRQLLEAEGIDAIEAGHLIEAALEDKIVVSDNPEVDGMWLIRLKPFWMHEGVRSIRDFERRMIYDLSRSLGYEAMEQMLSKVRVCYPHIHRAGPDAQSMAATFRFLIDPDFREFIARTR